MIVSDKINILTNNKNLEEAFFDIYVKEMGYKNE